MPGKNAAIIHEVSTEGKAVAFTFDDGPNPVYTPQILEIFREAGARATFFMIGEQMEANPDVVRAVHAEGHEIGNHTYSHPALPEIGEASCRDELARTEVLIEGIIGRKPWVFRPPYFAYDEMVETVAGEFGYEVIGAVNGAAKDWGMPGVDHIVGTTREVLRPGSILLFHDGYEDRSRTVEAVRILVSELREKGYDLVTVSELLHLRSE